MSCCPVLEDYSVIYIEFNEFFKKDTYMSKNEYKRFYKAKAKQLTQHNTKNLMVMLTDLNQK